MRLLKTALFVIAGALVVYIYLYYRAADDYIVWNLRLPRLLLALSAGFVLAEVGAVFQIMLNNPLADPYILGTSSGAALGGAIAAALGMWALAPLLGFAGALGAMTLVWALSHLGGGFDPAKLLLSGVIVGMLAGSGISLLMYFRHEDLGVILGILMGDLGTVLTHAEWMFFLIGLGAVAIVSLYLFWCAHSLNLLTGGDLSARSLGVDPYPLRRRMFVLCSLMIGFIVSFTGVIAFVGLIVPHIARRLFGAGRRLSIPLCGLTGALLLTACDFIAQHLLSVQLPVGVVTTLVGAPFFLALLGRRS
jgi:iron complex transport system permease protein